MKQAHLIPLVVSIISVLSLAARAAEPGPCSGWDVFQVQRPTAPSNTPSQEFAYKYRLIKGTDPNLPVILYLNGGPGLPSIGSSLPKTPGTFSVIQTDIRGVGCNADPRIPHEALRTEYLAADIQAVIKHAGLSNYLIYGMSYGTALATVVAAGLEASGLPLPKAVILEGTLGKAFDPGTVYREFIRQWELTKTRLSPEVLQELASERPLGHSPEAWGAFLSNLLTWGELPGNGNVLETYLGFAAPGAPPAYHAMLEAQLQKMETHAIDPTIERVFKVVSCTEIADDETGTDVYFRLRRGEAVIEQNGYCGKLRLLGPFDSRRFQINAPIYYFQGDRDPATPLDSALYHFRNQVQSKQKVFVTVKNGGHAALVRNLADCAPRIWERIAQGRSDLGEALDACQLSVEFRQQ